MSIFDEEKARAPEPLPNNAECDGCSKSIRHSSQAVWKKHQLCWACFSRVMDEQVDTEKAVAEWCAAKKGKAA